jgi:hypothetical protein
LVWTFFAFFCTEYIELYDRLLCTQLCETCDDYEEKHVRKLCVYLKWIRKCVIQGICRASWFEKLRKSFMSVLGHLWVWFRRLSEVSRKNRLSSEFWLKSKI